MLQMLIEKDYFKHSIVLIAADTSQQIYNNLV